MSHTMNIATEMKDETAIRKAAVRLGYPIVEGDIKLFASTENGLGVKLPGWNFPIVIKKGGGLAYDNYNGRWGDIGELNKFKAHYGLEKAKAEAQKKGYRVFESFDKEKRELVLKIQTGRRY